MRSLIVIHRTFNPISDTAKIHAKLEEVAAELSDDMSQGGWTGKTVTLKYKLDTYKGTFEGLYWVCHELTSLIASNFSVYTRAKSLDKWVSTKKEDLFAVCRAPVLVSMRTAPD